MRALSVGLLIAVASALAGCGGSAATTARPAQTTSTTIPFPRNVAVSDGTHVVSWGDSNGVRWFYSHRQDSEYGACFEFDSDPALRRALGAKMHMPYQIEIGTGDFMCVSPPKRPGTPADVFWDAPIIVVKAARSDDAKFSVVAGEAAPGVDAVQAHYSDGTVQPLPLDSSHVFVVINKPATAAPILTTHFNEKSVTCRPDLVGGEYNCDPQSMH